ncbi:transcriptional regulator [Bizionia gelidisalsuginis]|nr:transcriptional regulator [Bizionia gelidisalsuginis]
MNTFTYNLLIMTSIITGDIISSRSGDPNLWLTALKSELNKYGASPKQWEIYRGDSFQLEILPKTALKTALLLKATIKQFKSIDVRLAIGVGEKTYDAESITESNGSAFVNSGDCFEGLKKSTLAIKTEDATFNNPINIMLDLALLTMDYWTPKAALLFKTTLEHSDYNQVEIAKVLNRKQSNISAGLKRTGYDEISKMLQFYNTQF